MMAILMLSWLLPIHAAEASEKSNRSVKPQPQVTGAPTPSSQSKRLKGRKREAAKDADGSTAPNRFEAETVIKSQYTLDGKPLEVDPD